eukprot:GHVN01089720.1.p1 GENE.GHVN01089720.1~~GHVN01089720.1.p1  ORF type:complete len:105 (+),score=32.16 GHVN01089720.1:338-652(+)
MTKAKGKAKAKGKERTKTKAKARGMAKEMSKHGGYAEVMDDLDDREGDVTRLDSDDFSFIGIPEAEMAPAIQRVGGEKNEEVTSLAKQDGEAPSEGMRVRGSGG